MQVKANQSGRRRTIRAQIERCRVGSVWFSDIAPRPSSWNTGSSWRRKTKSTEICLYDFLAEIVVEFSLRAKKSNRSMMMLTTDDDDDDDDSSMCPSG